MLVYEPPHGRFSVNAVEPSLEYSHVLFERLKVEPSATYFDWSPDEVPRPTVEASLKLSYLLGSFRVTSGNNVDLRADPGAYFGTVGGEYQRVSHRWTLGASLDLGWATSDYNKLYFARDIAAIDLVEATLSVRYDMTDLVYFTVHTEGSTLVALTLQRSVQEPTLFSGGASLGVDY